jgi:hypothetical protein
VRAGRGGCGVARQNRPALTIQDYWGAPEPYGLLTLDWTDVGYPAVISTLQALMPPRTGPGVG